VIGTWSRTKNLLRHHPSPNFTGGPKVRNLASILAHVAFEAL